MTSSLSLQHRFSNGLPGLATALADRNPVFVITSSPPLRDAETNALQGFHDQVVIASTLTKWAHRVTVTEEIPSLVSFGIRTATGGAPGMPHYLREFGFMILTFGP